VQNASYDGSAYFSSHSINVPDDGVLMYFVFLLCYNEKAIIR